MPFHIDISISHTVETCSKSTQNLAQTRSYHSLSIKKNSRLQVYQYGTIYFPFQRWMKSMKYCLILSMTPEKNISVSSETLYRSMNVRTTNCNTIKGKIWRSELQLIWGQYTPKFTKPVKLSILKWPTLQSVSNFIPPSLTTQHRQNSTLANM